MCIILCHLNCVLYHEEPHDNIPTKYAFLEYDIVLGLFFTGKIININRNGIVLDSLLFTYLYILNT